MELVGEMKETAGMQVSSELAKQSAICKVREGLKVTL
jgi:hypothetical protein